jgi:hypothetical protein
MAGQPSAPEDHAATLLPAEPRSQDTVFMACVQRRFRSWELMVRSRAVARVTGSHRSENHEAKDRASSFETRAKSTLLGR